jgi:hypothetical protein
LILGAARHERCACQTTPEVEVPATVYLWRRPPTAHQFPGVQRTEFLKPRNVTVVFFEKVVKWDLMGRPLKLIFLILKYLGSSSHYSSSHLSSAITLVLVRLPASAKSFVSADIRHNITSTCIELERRWHFPTPHTTQLFAKRISALLVRELLVQDEQHRRFQKSRRGKHQAQARAFSRPNHVSQVSLPSAHFLIEAQAGEAESLRDADTRHRRPQIITRRGKEVLRGSAHQAHREDCRQLRRLRRAAASLALDRGVFGFIEKGQEISEWVSLGEISDGCRNGGTREGSVGFVSHRDGRKVD